MNGAGELNEREWQRQMLETLKKIERHLAPEPCVYEARETSGPLPHLFTHV